MAKRKSDGSGWIIILLIIIFALSSVTEWVKTHQELVIGVAGLIISYYMLRMLWRRHRYNKWVNYIKEKYNHNQEIVNGILNGRIWTGQSSEQLLDSLGNPDGIDKQVLKTKTKEVWKYHETRKGQYTLKIMIEKDEVVGWDKKG